MNKPPNSIPKFATDQRAEIVRILREAGPQGVSKESLIFDKHMTQCGASVHELEAMGYQIRHDAREGERYVTFVLVSEPDEPRPLTLHRKTFSTYDQETQRLRDEALPLFAGVRR